MSIEYAITLCKRAHNYLNSAIRNFKERNYDVSILEAGIASELMIKALIIALGYEPPRTHEIRQLLLALLNHIKEKKFEDIVNEVESFIGKFRKELIILEDSRRLGQYCAVSIDYDRAKITINIVKKILKLIESIWKKVLGSSTWCI